MSNKIYQYSVISALAQGLCSGGLPAAHVLSKGDHGIGTLADLDGELVIVDSQAYKFTSAGDAQPLNSSETVPFVMTTFFKPAKSVEVSTLTHETLLKELLDRYKFSTNSFVAVRVEGFFPQLTYRVAGPQARPREPFGDVMQRQRVDSLQDQRGSIFGFWSPEFTSAVTVAGLHLHFISLDKSKGGHLLGFRAINALLSAAVVNNFHLELPQTEEFESENIRQPDQMMMRHAEGMGA
ncbi:hypothetical protein IFM5058_09053 [Aspergillus udagawae]|nr:hypothetical protein IFM5058_09053 [Aspergillus udagawae]